MKLLQTAMIWVFHTMAQVFIGKTIITLNHKDNANHTNQNTLRSPEIQLNFRYIRPGFLYLDLYGRYGKDG